MNYQTTPNTARQRLIEAAATMLAKGIVASRVKMTAHEFSQETVEEYQHVQTQRSTAQCISVVLAMAETPDAYKDNASYPSFHGITDYWGGTSNRAIKMLVKAVETLAVNKAERRISWLLSQNEDVAASLPYAMKEHSVEEIFAPYNTDASTDASTETSNTLVFDDDDVAPVAVKDQPYAMKEHSVEEIFAPYNISTDASTETSNTLVFDDDDEDSVILRYNAKMPILKQDVLAILAVYVKLHDALLDANNGPSVAKQALENEHSMHLRCIALSLLHDAIVMNKHRNATVVTNKHRNDTVDSVLEAYPLPRLAGMFEGNDVSLIETMLKYVNPNLYNIVIEITKQTDTYAYCTALAGLPDGPDGVTVRNITRGLCHKYLSPLDAVIGGAKFQRGAYGTWDILQTIVYDLGLNGVYTTRTEDSVEVKAQLR